MADKITLTLDEIESRSAAALHGHGAGDWQAATVARAVVRAEETGNIICGLYYLESYCLQLESGRIDGVAEPVVTTDRPGAVRVDGRLGFAQSAFAAGFPTAVAAARANGICGMSVEHTHTCTSLGYFTEQFAREGLLAIGATNASPRVSPPGGSVPVLGTNPIAMAVPDGDGGIALQFDFSTSAVALGKITMAAAAGEEIPLGWAVDAEGIPTSDPEAALAEIGGDLICSLDGREPVQPAVLVVEAAGVVHPALTRYERRFRVGRSVVVGREAEDLLAELVGVHVRPFQSVGSREIPGAWRRGGGCGLADRGARRARPPFAAHNPALPAEPAARACANADRRRGSIPSRGTGDRPPRRCRRCAWRCYHRATWCLPRRFALPFLG